MANYGIFNSQKRTTIDCVKAILKQLPCITIFRSDICHIFSGISLEDIGQGHAAHIICSIFCTLQQCFWQGNPMYSDYHQERDH